MPALIEKCESIEASRRLGIGGSIAAAVVGFNRHRTRHEALAEILGLAPKMKPSRAMEIGTLSQPMIKHFYEDDTGFKGYTPGDELVWRHPKHPWMICHPDWIANDGNSGAEFKVAGLHTFKEWGDPEHCQVPQEYMVQCLHCMIVTGIRKWDLAVLIGTEFKIYPIKWDEAQALSLFQAERDFWQKHVVNKEPLPVDGSEGCKDLITWMHPKDKEPLDFATGEARDILNLLAEVKVNYEAEEGNYEELCNKARALIGDREGLRTEKITATWKANKKGVRTLRLALAGETNE